MAQMHDQRVVVDLRRWVFSIRRRLVGYLYEVFLWYSIVSSANAGDAVRTLVLELEAGLVERHPTEREYLGFALSVCWWT